MDKEKFLELAKNESTYRTLKEFPIPSGKAKVGDKFRSKILYDMGYNMLDFIERGYLERIPDVFDFEHEVIGKNQHSVHTWCPECFAWSINMPLEKECGCGYPKGITYYDAETIDNYIKTILTQ